MDILKSSQLVIFSHSTIFITFSYRSLAGFLLKTLTKFETAKTGSGVGFLRLTAVCLVSGRCRGPGHKHIRKAEEANFKANVSFLTSLSTAEAHVCSVKRFWGIWKCWLAIRDISC